MHYPRKDTIRLRKSQRASIDIKAYIAQGDKIMFKMDEDFKNWLNRNHYGTNNGMEIKPVGYFMGVNLDNKRNILQFDRL